MSKNVLFYEKEDGKYINDTINLNMNALHKFLFRNIVPGSTVLDLGFGSGREMIFLKEKLGCNVIGLDQSDLFVKKAKEKGLEVFQSDLSNINEILEENSIDTIISVAMLLIKTATKAKLLIWL
jgi:cyclopropane fatty-acyl-phospholipid synthase-like methyltransferase